MTKSHLVAAAALILGSTGAALAQDYGSGPVGSAADTASGVARSATGVASYVVGGVGDLVGGVVADPGQILTGRSAYEGGYGAYGAPADASQCTVTGGGAVGTCNSALFTR